MMQENGRFTLFSCPVCPLSDYENNCPAVASFLSATYLSTNSDDSDCDTQVGPWYTRAFDRRCETRVLQHGECTARANLGARVSILV
jgi:hypothetical protein